MATVIRFVNPASSGGDGTTNGLSGPTAAYASLSSWEAAEQTDLVAAGDIHEVRCEGTADTTLCDIDGWTTGASNYILIIVELANRHSGVWNTGKYHLTGSRGFNGFLKILEDFVRTEGLQVQNTSTSSSNTSAFHTSGTVDAGDVRASEGIFRGGGGSSKGMMLRNVDVFYGWNNIVYDADIAIEMSNGSNTYHLYSCTAIGITNGIKATSGTITAKNCYAKGTTAYSGTVTMTTCASSDTTGSAGLQNIAYSTTNFINVTGGSENLGLVSGTALIGSGTDTSGDSAPLDFTDDIIGTARGVTWDVGAFEFIAAAAGRITKLAGEYRGFVGSGGGMVG